MHLKVDKSSMKTKTLKNRATEAECTSTCSVYTSQSEKSFNTPTVEGTCQKRRRIEDAARVRNNKPKESMKLQTTFACNLLVFPLRS